MPPTNVHPVQNAAQLEPDSDRPEAGRLAAPEHIQNAAQTEPDSDSVQAAKKFIPPPGLETALRGAIKLDQPLLLTGEPGTGKTTVADWANWILNKDSSYHPKPLKFVTKTTSHATDLFYTYDALSHFQAVNLKGQSGERTTAEFIELQALGQAIAMTNPAQPNLSLCRSGLKPDAQPQNVVVLIDEVDKAPRDFVNDILDEILTYSFRIREQGNCEIGKDKDRRIVVVLTSNSEKGLPEAFLRRCAFFHIEFPDKDALRSIVAQHFDQTRLLMTPEEQEQALDFFMKIRDKKLRKQPATAELLGWLEVLALSDFKGDNWKAPENRTPLLENLAFLVKTQEDLETVKKML